MAFDWSTVISDLETGLAFVQKIAPAASVAGPLGATIGSVVSSVAGLASSYLNEATAAEAVISSSDLAQIQALTVQLQTANDQLSEQVVNS